MVAVGGRVNSSVGPRSSACVSGASSLTEGGVYFQKEKY